MTETERKALALVNEVAVERGGNAVDRFDFDLDVIGLALLRAIEQHEAFRREVSDAVEKLLSWPSIRSQGIIVENLARFILPKPVDPLVEALQENWPQAGEMDAEYLRKRLAARGLEIREKQP